MKPARQIAEELMQKDFETAQWETEFKTRLATAIRQAQLEVIEESLNKIDESIAGFKFMTGGDLPEAIERAEASKREVEFIARCMKSTLKKLAKKIEGER